ncbi:putative quinol monooxygenase [Rhizorhabdus wittichii]|jgi:quinol monooxygenase YgiN|uniref:Antibiotic biosynthesis monooxygenase n=3 Tax=Rhizorhabdus wittichii TaxID=160791 RepID=A0A9J9HFB3_RHIWR|nr:antibiotic biosynthesis monooxygenase family protein [Rhizorhabdus wittichii]ABQ70589.1 Antibiotic biosynthesis monooxygenase [Rhizorhabdus wittichii RW1]QTH23893.1 antibiotic biosynthesis monooxygenase [Rhizorhabdus wittichii]
MMMGVIARVRIHGDRQADWERIFAERRERVLATEPGTLAYDLLRSQDDPLVYMAVERFTDRDAYLAHRAGSVGHEAMLACMDGDPDITYLDPVPGCW